MITHPLNDGPGQDAAQVQAFFDQWELYRKVLDLDYLSHREAYATIAAELRAVAGAFSFLDLGAGDAECTVRALTGTPVRLYEAVDLSSVALELARRRAEALDCEKRFLQEDFVSCVEAMTDAFDVVFIGLSFHHLPSAHKRRFLSRLRRIVQPAGRLMFYEPILRPGESRGEFLERWWRFAQANWTGLDKDELARVRAHIFESDHPESGADYREMLAEAGFERSRVLFTSADDLYAVIEGRS